MTAFWDRTHSQAVVAEASARLGLPNRYIERPPWRPTNRLSRFEHAVSFGWTGYLRGDREMAQAYAVKAIRLIPWRSDGWRLLACTVLKLGRRRTLSSTGPGGS